MSSNQGYGQYCPLAMASTLLGNRWTLLLIREFMEGSTRFNDLARGLPLLSRSLLKRRLQELEDNRLITHRPGSRGKSGECRLTPAGEDLTKVIFQMATWGQEWIDEEPSLKDIDGRFLIWDMGRNVKPTDFLPNPFTVHFIFEDAPEEIREHWLVFEQNEVDACYIDPGKDVDVFVETGLRTMTRVWMGWCSLEAAIRDGDMVVTGQPLYIDRMREWLGLSSLASTQKRPVTQRIGQALSQ